MCLLAATARSFAQTAHFSGTQSVLNVGSLSGPNGIAVDSNGNLYIADTTNQIIFEAPWTGNGYGTQITLANATTNGAQFSPRGLAIDAAGNLYFADAGANRVNELPWNSVSSSFGAQIDLADQTTVNTSFVPVSVAVDTTGNVYFADSGNAAVDELPWNSGTSSFGALVAVGSGYGNPAGVAVDASGDVFVADSNGTVWEVPSGSSSKQAIASSTSVLANFVPVGVELDSSGNVYIADNGDGRVVEVPWNGTVYGTEMAVGGAISTPTSVVVDASAKVYVTSLSTSSVVQLNLAVSDLGAVSMGSAVASKSTVTFTFDSAGTLGSWKVGTQGATGLDFADAGTGTCVASTPYNAGDSCTVVVTFLPHAVGLRIGAAQLLDNSGSVIATARLRGVGSGPEVVFPGNPTISAVGSGFASPVYGAVDASGDVFVIDGGTTVKEIVAAGGQVSSSSPVLTIASGFHTITAIAVDGSGNVYVNDGYAKEIVAVNGAVSSSSQVVTLRTGTYGAGMALDSYGNLFLANPTAGTVEELVAVNGTVTSSSPRVVLVNGLSLTQGVAVDANNNVFFADFGHSAVKELVAVNGVVTGSSALVTLSTTFTQPSMLATDANGDVFVSDVSGWHEIVAISGAVSTSSHVVTSSSGSMAAATGQLGKGYFTNCPLAPCSLSQEDFTNPTGLSFDLTSTGVASSDSPQPLAVENAGNTDLTFPIPSINNPSISTGFTLDGSTNCPQLTASSPLPLTLSAGPGCNYSIDFIPTVGQLGMVQGQLILTDNNLNAPGPNYAMQSISLQGSAIAITITTAANVNAGFNSADQAMPLSATVASGSPVIEGAVTFTVVDGSSNQIGLPVSGIVSGGIASATYILPGGTPPGSYTIQAVYTDTCGSSPCVPQHFSGSSDTSHAITVSSTAYVVNTNADDATGNAANCPYNPPAGPGTCTLRDALAAAAAAGSGNISFDPTVFTAANLSTNPSANIITITTGGTLAIPADTSITGLTSGSGASLTNLVTVSGGGAVGVFVINSGTIENIANLNIVNGSDPTAGGLAINSGAVSVNIAGTTFSGNTTNGAGGSGSGGAIANSGILTITGSTFTGNSASGTSLLSNAGGAMYNVGSLTVINSTFTGNSAEGFSSAAGAIENIGTLTLTNSTIYANRANNDVAGSGGVDNASFFTLSNGIVSGNWIGSASAVTFYDDLDDTTGNNDFSTSFSNGGGDVVGYYNNPQPTAPTPVVSLALLGNYGGPTQTVIPLPGSAAFCAGVLTLALDANQNPLTADQRGLPLAPPYCPSGSIDAGAVQTNYSIGFVQQPTAVTQGIAMSPVPTVVLNESGNPFFDGTDSIAIPLTLTGNGVLTGGSASTSPTTGVVTYSNLSVNLPGTGDIVTANLTLNSTITASLPIALSAGSSQFNVNAGAPGLLVYGTMPAAALTAGGNAGNAITVQEETVNSDLITRATDTITLNVTGPGSYSKTYTQAAQNGVATFNLGGAMLSAAGNYSYVASLTGTTNASASETVSPGAASSLAATAGSGQNAAIGAAFSQALVVKVSDNYSNPVPGVTVNFAAPPTGASAVLSALSATTAADGTASVTATANGIASSTAYAITATISGAPATSIMLTNAKAATTLAVTPSATALVYGQPVTISAVVSPATVAGSAPTGSVSFFDSGSPLTPSTTLSGTSASFSVSLPAVGSHTYAAQFGGDTNFQASSQTPGPAVLISKAAATLSGPASAPSFAYGAGGTITIALAGQFSGTGIAQPTGNVTYTIGTGSAQTAAISSGTATLTIPASQAVGASAVVVNYGGDANYNTATSISVNFSVSKAAATLTGPAVAPTFTYGVGGSVSIAIAGQSSGSGIAAPTGSVTYTIGSGSAQTAAISSGSATLAVPASLAAGTYPVVVNYAGDANYNVAAAVSVSLTIGKAAATMKGPAGTPAFNYGVGGTVSITITGQSGSGIASPTGSVTYTIGSGSARTAAISSGSATLTVPASLAAGTYPVVVNYAGDANYNAAAAISGNLTINKAAATLSGPATAPSLTYGAGGTISIAIAGASGSGIASPTGSVTYTIGSGAAQTATISSGSATLAVPATLAAGTYPVSVNYAGDTNYDAATAISVNLTIGKASATLSGPATAPSLTYGAGGTISIAIAGASGSGIASPTGSVTYTIGSGAAQTATISSGGATLAVPATLAAGAYPVSVHYAGDTDYSAATAISVNLTIGKAAATLSGPATAPSLTYGVGGTISIAIAGASGSGIVSPTGSISYTIGSGAAQTAAIVSGVATLNIPATQAAGSYAVLVNYAGDANYNAATAVSVNITVGKAAAVLTWTPASSMTYGTGLSGLLNASAAYLGSNVAGTFAYTATPAGGSAAAVTSASILPAGNYTLSVSFTPTDTTDFNAASGSASLAVKMAGLTIAANNATRAYGAANPAFTGAVTGAVNGDTFTETFTSSATVSSAVGTYSIVPSVAGSNLSDYSQTVTDGTLTITQASSTTALTVSSGSVTPGQNVTLTAQVAPQFSGSPTGTVSFYDGTALLGTSPVSAGTAAYSTAALAPGLNHSLTATYSGDTNFTGSSSGSTVTVVVAPLDFTITLDGASTESVNPGSTATYNVDVTPTYGAYPGPIAFSVTGLPAGASVTFSPSTIPANAGAQKVVVTVQTAANTASVHPSSTRPWSTAALALLLLPLLGARRMRRQGRRLARFLCLALFFGSSVAGLFLTTGCGGSSKPNPQTYTVTVTASSGSVQRTVNVTLTVQ